MRFDVPMLTLCLNVFMYFVFILFTIIVIFFIQTADPYYNVKVPKQFLIYVPAFRSTSRVKDIS